jgi:cytochrome c-type biogenesis protein CcmH/NrfG
MTTSDTTHTQSGLSRRAWRWIAIITVALLMFIVGYSLGGFRSAHEPEPDAASFGDTAETHGTKLGSLDSLLPGLEAKVAANPRDTGQRTLLAQTYNELGKTDKAIEQFRILGKQSPGDNETRILLATSLINRSAPADLSEASKLLDDAVRAKPAVAPMARLYQGEIRMKLGDRPGAIKIWKDYVGQMSAADPRRQMFEEKIAQASGHP